MPELEVHDGHLHGSRSGGGEGVLKTSISHYSTCGEVARRRCHVLFGYLVFVESEELSDRLQEVQSWQKIPM